MSTDLAKEVDRALLYARCDWRAIATTSRVQLSRIQDFMHKRVERPEAEELDKLARALDLIDPNPPEPKPDAKPPATARYGYQLLSNVNPATWQIRKTRVAAQCKTCDAAIGISETYVTGFKAPRPFSKFPKLCISCAITHQLVTKQVE